MRPPNWKTMLVIAGLAFAMSHLPACSYGPPSSQQRFDASNDGKISLEASQSWREAIFVRLDGDEDGSLTKDEYFMARTGRRSGFRSRGRRSEARQEARAERFAEMDSDSNELVSKEEYLEYGRQRFVARDTDGDGLLTREDFRAFRRNLRSQGPPFSRRGFDANNDGKISLEESLNRSEARFVRLDGDGDSSLTKDEYVTFRIGQRRSARNERRQQARAARFTEIDTDGDDLVSKEEYLKHAELRFSSRDANGDGFLTRDDFRAR